MISTLSPAWPTTEQISFDSLTLGRAVDKCSLVVTSELITQASLFVPLPVAQSLIAGNFVRGWFVVFCG
jgi:hypothetical protein